MSEFGDIADILIRLCRIAGGEILNCKANGYSARVKNDREMVTDADLLANDILMEGIASEFAGVNVVTEEAHLPDFDLNSSIFFLIDPLDGTKEFINGFQDYTVNVALIIDGVPRVGVVCAPELGLTYAGVNGAHSCAVRLDVAAQALRHGITIQTRSPSSEGWTAVVSRSHNDERTLAFVKRFAGSRTIQAGSSLKFCKVAEGSADVYPRFGKTMEWDTAAGDAILRAAGGHVETVDGNEMRYGKKDFGYRNEPFVAWGKRVRPPW